MQLLRWMISLVLPTILYAQMFNCNFSPPGLRATCLQFQQFDINARRNIMLRNMQPQPTFFAPGVPDNNQLSPAVPQQSFNPSPYECMDLRCLCPYFRGRMGPGGNCVLPLGGTLIRATRKELRMMSDSERNRLFKAIQQLKNSGEYDRLSDMHRQVGVASGAHSGPSFLPWHREFLKRVEIAIRMVDPSLALPYWDSVLDSYLPDPRDSILWTPLFAGSTDPFGNVVNGPFAEFHTLEGRPNINRRLGSEGRLFTERNLNDIFSQTSIERILAYTAPQQGCPYPANFGALEYAHASVHLWVGGDMKPPVTAANDPIFYFHHSFVDLIFEQWRQTHQNRWAREREFPPDIPQCSNSEHFAHALMRPFNILNINGLSNAYTDHMYSYAQRPTCTMQHDCGSLYLFCSRQNGAPHCVSKIRSNGRCAGYENEDACYQGICIDGFCRSGAFQKMTTAAPQNATPSAQPASSGFISTLGGLIKRNGGQTLPIPTLNAWNGTAGNGSCFNDDPCCSLWALADECPRNIEYMSRYCKRSCGYCKNDLQNRTGCFDRHISCNYWRSQGECSRRRQWMAENCQHSCGWCHITAHQLCRNVARMSRM
uniref:ShKT domain-containing protein n=2 Tax=Parascaris univalens TaxID=6257 RepID=A0A915BPT9_PARUN